MDESKTPKQKVLEIFPNATDNEVEFLLWEKTAFPHGDNITEMLTTLKATLDSGEVPCDDCNEPSVTEKGAWRCCQQCLDEYEKMKADTSLQSTTEGA